jgi:putative transposase
MTCDPDKHHRRSIRLRGYDYTLAGAYFVTIVTQDRVCLLGEVVEDSMRLNDAGRMVRTVWDELPIFYPGVDIDEFVVMPNHIHGIIVLVGAAPRGRPEIGPDGVPNTGQARPDSGQARPDSGQARPDSGQARPDSGQARGPAPTAMALRDGIHLFKTMTTKRHADGVIQSVGAAPRGRPGIGTDGVRGSGPAQSGSGPDPGQARGPAPTAMSLRDTAMSLGQSAMSLGDVVHRFKTMTTKRYADGVKQSGWATFRGRLWQRNYYEHIIRDEPALDCIRRYIDENPLRWALDAENPHRTTS